MKFCKGIDFRRKKHINNYSFAVLGVYHAIGVTLLAINFACYLAECYGGKVALVELNGSGHFRRIEEELQSSAYFESIENGFRIKNIFFFSRVSNEMIPIVLERNFKFVVLDVGTDFVKHRAEFQHCNQKVIVGSSLEWRLCEYEQLISYLEGMEGFYEWEYLDILNRKSPTFVHDGRIKLKKMPYIANAFSVSEDAAKIYQSFL